MKKIIGLLSIVVLFFALVACNRQSKNGFSLEGKLIIPKKTKVELMYLGVDKATLVDSTTTSKNNSFKLGAPINHPALFALRIKGFDDIYLAIKPDDKIIIEIDNSISPIAYTVEGSTDSRLADEILSQQQRVRGKITRLSIDYENSKNNPETFEEQKIKFDSIYDNILETHKEYSINFIRNNPQSLACIFALYQNFGQQRSQPLFDNFNDIDIFNLVDSNLTNLYPETEAVIALNRDVTEIKEQIKQKKFSERLIAPGRKAPNFDVTTIDNKKLSLSDFTNQVVVYCFFAVWNKASVKELIALNKFKQKYANRNIVIIGISFDSEPKKLETFIAENNINIPIACDYSYWNSEYVQQFGIHSIPDILLLDKNHIVHKRNINNQELIQIITEWKKTQQY